jgi:DNA-binding response OmpR family regulator
MSAMPGLVLIVEDEAHLREPLEQMLRMRGFDVVTADTARDAHVLMRDHEPAAAVVDLCLKEGSGRDVIAQLPAYVPVVIFSATAWESGELERTRPRTCVIEKPASLARVVDALEGMLLQDVLAER